MPQDLRDIPTFRPVEGNDDITKIPSFRPAKPTKPIPWSGFFNDFIPDVPPEPRYHVPDLLDRAGSLINSFIQATTPQLPPNTVGQESPKIPGAQRSADYLREKGTASGNYWLGAGSSLLGDLISSPLMPLPGPAAPKPLPIISDISPVRPTPKLLGPSILEGEQVYPGEAYPVRPPGLPPPGDIQLPERMTAGKRPNDRGYLGRNNTFPVEQPSAKPSFRFTAPSGITSEIPPELKELPSFRPITPEEIEPSAAKIKGGVKIGADVTSLGKVLGSSLYQGDISKIAAKELLQNSIDAVRHLGPEGNVDVNLDKHKGFVEVSDNGKGLTRKELETVFTDLGSSGKRSDESAIGGFGLAKAAPLLGGQYVEVRTVVKEGNPVFGLVEHSFKGSPDDLLKGVEITTKRVPDGTPTGTTVKTYVPPNTSFYDANIYVHQLAQNSPGMQGSINVRTNPPEWDYTRAQYHPENKTYLPQSLEGADITKLHAPAANIDIIVPKDAKYGNFPVRYEILNNGMYQASRRHGYDETPGVPNKILVNIKPVVPEGHADYPFTANREQLRGSAEQLVEKYLNENIVNPGVNRRSAEIKRAYESMPEMQVGSTHIRKFYVYDVGQRFTPEELKDITEHPIIQDLATHISDNIADAMYWAGESAWDKRLEKIGLIFDETIKGIHIPNPGQQKSAILINPFEIMKHNVNPDQAAAGILHTILHEIGHLAGGAHDEQFAIRLSDIYEKYGFERAVEAQQKYLETISGTNPGGYLPEIYEILQRYTEARGRENVVNDPLVGTGAKSEYKGPGTEDDIPSGIGQNRTGTGRKGFTIRDVTPDKEPWRFTDVNGLPPTLEDIIDASRKQRTFIQKYEPKWKRLALVNNVSKSLRSTLDMSIPFRQGFGFVGREFFWKNIIPMVRAAKEKFFEASQQAIFEDPDYELAKKSGIEFLGGPVKHDFFPSSPVENWFGVRNSSRMAVFFTNKIRLDAWKAMTGSLSDASLGKFNPKTNMVMAEEIAKFINTYSGKGDFGRWEKDVPFMNNFFYSAPLIKSRVDMMNDAFNPATYYRDSWPVRKEKLRSLFSMAAFALTGATLAAYAGAEVSLDPEDADFLKIKVGNSRLDLLGGTQQYGVAAARMIMWAYKEMNGEKIERFKTGKDIAENFLVNKLSPLMNFGKNLLQGHSFGKKVFNIPQEIENLFVPMVTQDILEIIQDDPSNLWMTPMGGLGMGVQTYNKDEELSTWEDDVDAWLKDAINR